LGKPAF
jgi:hypothetical protein